MSSRHISRIPFQGIQYMEGEVMMPKVLSLHRYKLSKSYVEVVKLAMVTLDCCMLLAKRCHTIIAVDLILRHSATGWKKPTTSASLFPKVSSLANQQS